MNIFVIVKVTRWKVNWFKVHLVRKFNNEVHRLSVSCDVSFLFWFSQSPVQNSFNDVHSPLSCSEWSCYCVDKYWLRIIKCECFNLIRCELNEVQIYFLNVLFCCWFISHVLQLLIDQRDSLLWSSIPIDILWIFSKSIWCSFVSKILNWHIFGLFLDCYFMQMSIFTILLLANYEIKQCFIVGNTASYTWKNALDSMTKKIDFWFQFSSCQSAQQTHIELIERFLQFWNHIMTDSWSHATSNWKMHSSRSIQIILSR